MFQIPNVAVEFRNYTFKHNITKIHEVARIAMDCDRVAGVIASFVDIWHKQDYKIIIRQSSRTAS